MEDEKLGIFTKIFVLLTYVLMVTVNAMANILPINGIETGKVSDAYPNLFAPAGITFAIWGLIYLLLFIYTVYQLGYLNENESESENQSESQFESSSKVGLLKKTGIIFSVSSIVNACWIFSWHYNKIVLSMLLMIGLLICLIFINEIIKKETLSTKEKILIRLPFSIYFGWITVATIANATVLLVSLGWSGFGISDEIWAIVMIIAGMVIGISTMLKNKDVAYGLVLVWAYAGILLKHISESGFSGQYTLIIVIVNICIVMFIISVGYVLFYKKINISSNHLSTPQV